MCMKFEMDTTYGFLEKETNDKLWTDGRTSSIHKSELL